VDVVVADVMFVSRVHDPEPGAMVDVVVNGAVANAAKRHSDALFKIDAEMMDLIVFGHVSRRCER
jgi:hypothetical protein